MSKSRLDALRESDPEQFRQLMLGLDAITLKPHPGQQKVLDSNARFKVMNCGRRFGKTKLAAHIIVKEARKPNQMLWWTSPTYRVVKRGYAEVLSQLPEGVLTHKPPPDSHFDAGRAVILRFKNGTRMEFYSAERPEGMLGAGVDFAVLDEAATMPSRVFEQIIRPTLMDRKGGALLISTPRGRNYFYRMYQQGQDPQQPDFASWTFTSRDNPTLPEGEVENMRASMPRMEYEQEVEAKFLAAGSSTFVLGDRCVQHDQILENGMIEDSPPKGYVSLGIDLARTNDYTVLYACNMSNRRNVFFARFNAVTWPEQKRLIRAAEARIRRAGAESVLMMVDSTGVGDPVKEDLEADGYDVVGINFTTHKTNMVRLLAKDLEENRAFVLADAQVEEFENYTMALTPSGKLTYSAPEGEHDDVVSAKMLSHWGVINEGMGEVTVLTASPSNPRKPDEPNVTESGDIEGAKPVEREGSLGYDGMDPGDVDLALYDEPEDYSDLLDDDAAAMDAIGLGAQTRPPTPQELLANPDAWR